MPAELVDGNPALPGVSSADLARWGLLDQAIRERFVDELLLNCPFPEPERMMLLRHELEQCHSLDDPTQKKTWLQQKGLTELDFDRMAARRWQWLTWCRQHWGAELQTIFLRRKPELDQVTYSLLRLVDHELASELYLQIKEGEARFSDLAKSFSGGPEKNQGGLLGPVPLSQPHPALARLLQVSKPHQLWPPKQLEGWWVVVRLERFQPAVLDTAMEERLLLEQGEQLLENWLQQQHPRCS